MTNAIIRAMTHCSTAQKRGHPRQSPKKMAIQVAFATRRRFFIAVAICVFAAVPGYAAAPSATEASAFIEGTSKRLITIIDSRDSAASQASQLQAVVDGTVDVEGIARFCLGRYWPAASPEQRKTFLDLFHSVLLDGVTGQIRAYKGVTVTIGRAQAHDDGVSVSSVVQRPDKGPASVDWVVGSTSSGLKIEDVVAEGTSLRLTRRNDYATFLGSHGGNIDVLLAAMRQRLAQ